MGRSGIEIKVIKRMEMNSNCAGKKTGEIKVYFLPNLLETHFPVLIFFAS